MDEVYQNAIPAMEEQAYKEDYNAEGAEEAGDFNLEEEYKEPPLIPQGFYHGAITNVEYDPEVNTVIWTVTLDGNGGMASDGETPIDGQSLAYTNYLPLAGDENERTKKGTMSKRQAKINMLAQFVKDMKIQVNTMTDLMEGINNSIWIGKEVSAKVSASKWEGRVFNKVAKLVAA